MSECITRSPTNSHNRDGIISPYYLPEDQISQTKRANAHPASNV